MRHSRNIVLLLFVFAFTIPVFAQKASLRQANKLYRKLAYHEAVPFYLRALQIDSNNSVALHKIAECYRILNDYDNKEKYFAKVVTLSDASATEKYYYGMSLMENGKYDEGKRWVGNYQTAIPIDTLSFKNMPKTEKRKYFLHDTAVKYIVSNFTEINGDHSDFGPCIFHEGVLFSTNRYLLDGASNNHGWTGKDFYKIFYYDNQMKQPVKFASSVQTSMNDGPLSYDSKNNTLYITRNHIPVGKETKSKLDFKLLEIYSYTFDDKTQEWTYETPFANNDIDYNVAHPAVSPNGNTMIFSSDMPGGYGGMDLYVCKKRGINWGIPINLGPKINTKGNEVFPSLNADHLLIFSSNGIDGLGGLDLYYTYLSDVKPGLVEHFLAPVNSEFDDFGMVISDDYKNALFSSNRKGGTGDDDIYKATIINNIKPEKIFFDIPITGLVKSRKTLLPLEKVKVLLADNKAMTYAGTTSKDGTFSIPVRLKVNDTINLRVMMEKAGYHKEELNFKYVVKDTNAIDLNKTFDLLMTPIESNVVINLAFFGLVRDKKTLKELDKVSVVFTDKRAITFKGFTAANGIFKIPCKVLLYDTLAMTIMMEKEGYLREELKFKYIVKDTNSVDMNKFFDLLMTPLDAVVADDLVGRDLMKRFIINPIYFDFNKYNIRPDAAIELNKIVKIMKDYPNMIIDLSSHTDCKGTMTYNEKLSDNRAKSSMAYLISKGINPARLTAKGYGETKPVNDCRCEGTEVSTCTPAMHQLNRRTEFNVRSM